MDTSQAVKRKVVELTFSRDFEALLLGHPTPHTSLTHDLELAIERGLQRLIELEDVRELQHQSLITHLVAQTNLYQAMESEYFDHWKIAVSEDLLDEVDLLLLSHGKDLVKLGLFAETTAATLLMLAVAGLR
ncbi:MAG: hypothetical protein U0520_04325 [Candidatus Saccharimonadales bacterium]